MYEERLYRQNMGKDLDYFTLSVKETDLWIALSKGFTNEALKLELKKYIIKERIKINEYILLDPQFGASLIAYKVKNDAPEIIKKMSDFSFCANVGPMAGVAGAFSLLVGNFLKSKGIPEIIVENGGDIFVYGKKNLTVGVYAGSSVFSNKINLEISIEEKGLGICSSSASFGHSLSFGKADLVTIISKDVVLADLFATAVCNKVKSKEDIGKIINDLKNNKEILAAMIIMEDKLGVFGNITIRGRN